MLQCLVCGTLLYTAMVAFWPKDPSQVQGPIFAESISAIEADKDPMDNISYVKTFLNTMLQVTTTLFCSGPVKVFCDIKRGETSF